MKTVSRYLNVLMVPLFVVALTLLAGCGASGTSGSADSGGSSTALGGMGGGGGGGDAPVTTASPAGGTYESAEVVVSLNCDGDCAATYYTYNTDGAVETPTTLYTGPITLSTNTNCVTLRFYSVSSTGTAEAVKTEIYFLYPGGGGDTTAPALTTHNPADNATSVSINMSISASFNEALSGGSIAVTGVSGSSSITGSTVTFALSSDLAYSTTYNAKVSGAQDASGNVAVDHSWSFTTEDPAGDTTPPTVSSTSPVNGGTNVAVGGTIHAQFSEILDPATVSTSTFTLSGPGGSVSGAVLDHADGNIMFTPNSSLANDSVYTATVTTGIADLAGNNLASNYSWTFTTESAGGDTTPPTVSSVTPASGVTNVAVDSTVHAQFSEILAPATVNTSTFTLSGPGGSVSGTVFDHADGNIMFTPNSNLTSGSSYTATVTTGITDLAGNALVSSYSWSFTTAAGDTTAPTVSSTSPANGDTGVAIDGSVHAQFSEALDPATVNTSTFTLSGPGGSVSGAVVDHGAGYIMFTPNSNLANDSAYTATVTTGITDLAGNNLASAYSWNFTTVAPPSGGFDAPLTQPASQSSYSSNTFGLITASTLQGWKSNWSASKAALGITGKLIILQVGSGSYVGGTGVDCSNVSSYDAPYNTIAPYEEKRNNGLFSTVSMVADGASADVYLKMFAIDPANDMVVVAMNSYSSNNFFLHGRIYYFLRYWGMAAENLALLNGDVNSNSGSIDTTGSAPCGHPNSGTWTVQSVPDNTGLQAGTGEMLSVARGDWAPPGGAFMWDARTYGEYTGNPSSTFTRDETSATYVAFEGTIRVAPGNSGGWIEWSSLISSTTGAFNSKSSLQTALNNIGYTSTDAANGRVIYTWCRTAYRAMASFVVGSVIMGYPTKVYDGSWIEWGELTSANGGGLPGALYSANSSAATDSLSGPNGTTSSTYPTNKVSNPVTASQIIIDDKAYKGITWSSGILVPSGTSGEEY